jgi:hypothetical protein
MESMFGLSAHIHTPLKSILPSKLQSSALGRQVLWAETDNSHEYSASFFKVTAVTAQKTTIEFSLPSEMLETFKHEPHPSVLRYIENW